MARSKPPVVPLHQLRPGQIADVFALLTEKQRGTTRDKKPFFTCKFRDRHRVVSCQVWADAPQYGECESDWQPGMYFKIRGLYVEHDKYGPKLDLQQIRPVQDGDRDDGFVEANFVEQSRFQPEAMLVELRALVEREISDLPLRNLTLDLLTAHAEVLPRLPAHPRNFYPFPGGWLEHTLSVTKSVLLLTDRYIAHYPELKPPLNRDLLVAGSVLHDIGRVAELIPGTAGQPTETTIPGHLLGPHFLARDLIRTTAMSIPDLNPQLLLMLEHIVVTHLSRPEWGSPRLPAIPEVLILHHADDLDAKMEMYVRCLTRDQSEGPFTERDPILGKALLKDREV